MRIMVGSIMISQDIFNQSISLTQTAYNINGKRIVESNVFEMEISD